MSKRKKNQCIRKTTLCRKDTNESGFSANGLSSPWFVGSRSRLLWVRYCLRRVPNLLAGSSCFQQTLPPAVPEGPICPPYQCSFPIKLSWIGEENRNYGWIAVYLNLHINAKKLSLTWPYGCALKQCGKVTIVGWLNSNIVNYIAITCHYTYSFIISTPCLIPNPAKGQGRLGSFVNPGWVLEGLSDEFCRPVTPGKVPHSSHFLHL